MAPELFNINAVSNEGNSGLSTRESDAFALGMVTFEVMDVPHGMFFHSFETPPCTFRYSLDKRHSQSARRQRR